jgi:hypothetical protein
MGCIAARVVDLPRFALLETVVGLPRFALLETVVGLPRFALLETVYCRVAQREAYWSHRLSRDLGKTVDESGPDGHSSNAAVLIGVEQACGAADSAIGIAFHPC